MNNPLQMTRVIRDSFQLKIPKAALVDLLNGKRVPLPDIPQDAEVFVRVPSGGDYSGTSLSLDDEVVLEITWTVEAKA